MTNGRNGHFASAPRATLTMPTSLSSSEGAWEWSLSDETDGTVRVAWEVLRGERTNAFESLDVEKLTAELSVDPSVAKDLHNFVCICQ